jgi:hypothetical protein
LRRANAKRILQPHPWTSEAGEMRDVTQILNAMGTEQCLLAFVFLGSYAFAMGELVEVRGRRIAVATAAAAALCFVVLSDPWEEGVMLVALAFVGMGLFSAAVWFVWRIAEWRMRSAAGASAR